MRTSLVLMITAGVVGCQAAGQEGRPTDAGSATCVERQSVNPSARLPYSAAVQAGGMAFLSGKIGATAETREMSEGRAAAETRNIMEAFREELSGMGLGFEDVVMGHVYLSDIDDYGAMNEVYGEYFPSDPPARVALSVNELPAGAALEISFVAVCR